MRKAIPFSLLLVLLGLMIFQAGCGSDEETPVTPAPKCNFDMTSPVAGQPVSTDKPLNIRWKRGTSEAVKIELFKGAVAVGTIKANHTNSGADGFYPWGLPETFGQGSGDDYWIKVSSVSNPDCSDQTAQFTITDVSNCSLQFAWAGQDTIPHLVAGQDLEIRWNGDGTTGLVRLELWYMPFSTPLELVGVITERTADTGSYIWPVRSFNRGTDEGYRLKILDYDIDDCVDISETFNITDENVCEIQVWGISEDQVLNPDQVIPISFAFENSSFVVKLKLFSGNEQVNAAPLYGVITNSFDTVNGTKSFPWTVSAMEHGGPAFNRFNIRAYDVDDEYCIGQSEFFTITQ